MIAGCTSAALRCHQIRVNYTRLPYEEFMAKPFGSIPWDLNETKFFVNTEGCGYPPRVNCSDFSKKYGYGNMGKIFPCYYSRTHPETVVARYNYTFPSRSVECNANGSTKRAMPDPHLEQNRLGRDSSLEIRIYWRVYSPLETTLRRNPSLWNQRDTFRSLETPAAIFYLRRVIILYIDLQTSIDTYK